MNAFKCKQFKKQKQQKILDFHFFCCCWNYCFPRRVVLLLLSVPSLPTNGSSPQKVFQIRLGKRWANIVKWEQFCFLCNDSLFTTTTTTIIISTEWALFWDASIACQFGIFAQKRNTKLDCFCFVSFFWREVSEKKRERRISVFFFFWQVLMHFHYRKEKNFRGWKMAKLPSIITESIKRHHHERQHQQ